MLVAYKSAMMPYVVKYTRITNKYQKIENPHHNYKHRSQLYVIPRIVIKAPCSHMLPYNPLYIALIWHSPSPCSALNDEKRGKSSKYQQHPTMPRARNRAGRSLIYRIGSQHIMLL